MRTCLFMDRFHVSIPMPLMPPTDFLSIGLPTFTHAFILGGIHGGKFCMGFTTQILGSPRKFPTLIVGATNFSSALFAPLWVGTCPIPEPRLHDSSHNEHCACHVLEGHNLDCRAPEMQAALWVVLGAGYCLVGKIPPPLGGVAQYCQNWLLAELVVVLDSVSKVLGSNPNGGKLLLVSFALLFHNTRGVLPLNYSQ